MDPSKTKVGSGPTEKMSRMMAVMMSVRMPAGLGKVMAMAADRSMTAQIKPDK
jgi:hypothetical protein